MKFLVFGMGGIIVSVKMEMGYKVVFSVDDIF